MLPGLPSPIRHLARAYSGGLGLPLGRAPMTEATIDCRRCNHWMDLVATIQPFGNQLPVRLRAHGQRPHRAVFSSQLGRSLRLYVGTPSLIAVAPEPERKGEAIGGMYGDRNLDCLARRVDVMTHDPQGWRSSLHLQFRCQLRRH